MKRFAIYLTASIALISCTGNHLRPVLKTPMWTSMGSYTPAEPKSLSEIPTPVRLKLLNHLRDRLGPFAERLTLTGGQIVDFERLASDEPASKNFKWEVHAYDLHFAFQMPSVGIRSYTAQIKLRSDGSVLKEIDLPAFASSPEKLTFITLEDAVSVAVGQGFNRKDIYPEITYFKDADSLVWTFKKSTSNDGMVIEIKNIYVSAHNGAVLKEFTSTAIR